jgi:hypothetical protein
MSKIRNFKWELSGSVLRVLSASSEAELAKFEADADWSDKIRANLLAYGLKQKLADSVSDVEGASEKIAGMSEMYAMLLDGEWMRERSGGTRTVSALVEAIARFKQAPIASVQKALAGYSAEQKKAIAAKPEIAALVKAIEDEREDSDEADLSDLA